MSNISGLARPESLDSDSYRAEFEAVLSSYQENPADQMVADRLGSLCSSIAKELCLLPKSDKGSPRLQAALGFLGKLNKSGFLDMPVSEQNLAVARENLGKGWPGIVGAMFLSPAWQLSEAPRIEQTPMWLWPVYVAYLFYVPQGFCAVGQAEAYAAHYERRIPELLRLAEANRGSAAVRSALNFYLSIGSCIPLYFSQGSLRPIYEQRAKLLALALGVGKQEDLPAFPREGRPLRIGFINRHFGPQTETYTTIPSFEHLDRDRFEVILFSFHQNDSALESYAKSRASEFRVLTGELSEQVQAVRNAQLDVVVLGTNVTAVCNEVTRLALFRLAPLQLVNNSSCTTSGMPQVDIYVSGDLTEAPEANEHFSERLGLLPGPAHAFNYEADRQDACFDGTRESLGISQDCFLFVSAANYYKVTPEMMHIWARLLASVPNSRLLLHPFNPNWSSSYPIKRFCRLFDQVLSEYGVGEERLVVSSTKFPSRTDVKKLMSLGDVYLDSFPFGGVNSLVDPLETGIPVVCWDGRTFRSRMGGALMRSLEIGELVTTSAEEYLATAQKLASDATWCSSLRQRIVSGMERTPLFLDTLAASDAFGGLVEAAYDELVKVGRPEFRKARTPIRASLPESRETLLLKGEQACQANDWATVQTIARQLIHVIPNSTEARHLLARALMENGAYDRAALYLSAAVQQAEGSASIWTDLGRAFSKAGSMQEAVKALDVAIRLDGSNVDPVLVLAEIALSCGELESYSELCAAAKEIAPLDDRVKILP